MQQNVFSSIAEFEEAEKYWLDRLSGELPEIRLPADFYRSAQYKPAHFKLTFENQENQESLIEKLIAVSKNNHLSLFVILLTVLKIVLYKWTHQNDIIVGAPIYTRNPRDYYKFVAFRDSVHPAMTFKDLLLNVRETVSAGYKNQCFPARNALKLLNIESGFSLFRVVSLLENIHQKELIKDITANGENDIIFSFRQDGNIIQRDVIYNSNLFEPATIRQFCRGYEIVLSQVLGCTDIKIADIFLDNQEERNRILFEFNNTRAGLPKNKTITQLFEEQAEKTPARIAILGREDHGPGSSSEPVCHVYVTYKELNQRANRLAGRLRGKNLRKNCIVALLMTNSVEMAIGIFGVLKAGAAYLPLAPGGPVERNKFILETGRADLLLLQGQLVANDELNALLPSWNIYYMDIDVDVNLSDDAAGYAGEIRIPPVNAEPAHLACVIYTSGTTGRPKGVLVEHKGIVNYTLWRLKAYNYSQEDVTLQPLSYCFDGFGSNFYSGLLSGGRLVMAPESGKSDFDYINKLMMCHQVTNISLVPGIFGMMLDRSSAGELKSLRFVVLAGDRSSPTLVKKCREKMPGLLLVNEYGPTESTVTAASHNGINEINTTVIGTPITNTRLYILNSSLTPVPMKITGELYISGLGLARGYLDNPELTADKFIGNPWVPGERMYRTGDLARRLGDGNIDFIGRIDSQVKIRGFRIELAEIQGQLLKREEIKDTVVVVREDETGAKFLCAYIVTQNTGQELWHKSWDIELREYLSKTLPDYMIPAFFINVKEIPVTPNGKVDGKALPPPGINREKQYKPPGNEIEKKLVDLWWEILKVEKDRISIDDNFFHLGGHSLKAAVLVAQIEKELHIDIPLSQIFKIPHIRGLAAVIKKAATSKRTHIPVEPLEKKDYYPLSAAQRRLYIVQQMDAEKGIAYNMPSVWQLEGNLDIEKFEAVFNQLIRRHESLRTSFLTVNDEPVQRVHGKTVIGQWSLVITEAGKNEIEDKIKNFIKPFDMSHAPLLRMGLLHTPALGRPSQKGNTGRRYILMVDMHHLITDGISLNLLIDEFIALYGRTELSPLKLQYKDYCQWQNQEKQKEKPARQQGYWLEEFVGEIPVLSLPACLPRPGIKSYNGRVLEFSITDQQAQTLKEFAGKIGATLYMVTLAIYSIFLSKLSGSEDILVGTPAAGRGHADFQNIIGMFVNTIVLRNYPTGEKTFKQFSEEVKTRTLQAFENQDYQFEDLVEVLGIKRNPGRNPLFDFFFTFQEQDEPGGSSSEGKTFKLKPFPEKFKPIHFDMILNVCERNGRLLFELEYVTKLFKEETIKRYINYFKAILAVVMENNSIKLKEITIIRNLSTAKAVAPSLDFGF